MWRQSYCTRCNTVRSAGCRRTRADSNARTAESSGTDAGSRRSEPGAESNSGADSGSSANAQPESNASSGAGAHADRIGGSVRCAREDCDVVWASTL